MSRWVVIAAALLCGLTLAGYDRRTDDTGVEVALLVTASLTLTLAAPRVAIAIALGVALPMAVLNGSYPGLVFSAIGAAIGYAMRRGPAPSRA